MNCISLFLIVAVLALMPLVEIVSGSPMPLSSEDEADNQIQETPYLFKRFRGEPIRFGKRAPRVPIRFGKRSIDVFDVYE